MEPLIGWGERNRTSDKINLSIEAKRIILLLAIK